MRIFYSYSHKDEALRDRLEKHLSALKQSGAISEWHDRKILAGDNFDRTISKYLDAADLILFLISADFLASRYIRDAEVKRAMERHECGAARVIPVILRPVDLHGVPFENLLRLPKDGIPVTKWKNRDSAFANIAEGIRAVAEQMGESKNCSARGLAAGMVGGSREPMPIAPASVPDFSEEPRLLDTGVAQEIPVGESREVLAMIHRPNGPGLADILKKEADSSDRLQSSYTVRERDVRSVPFIAPFLVSLGRSRIEPLKVKLELRAPGLEVSDSPIAVKIPHTADTGVLSFLVLSKDVGTQTLKVRIVCDDEEIVSNLLRAKFVQHGGPGPSSPGVGMCLEKDDWGRSVFVLAEAELVIKLTAKKHAMKYMQA